MKTDVAIVTLLLFGLTAYAPMEWQKLFLAGVATAFVLWVTFCNGKEV